MLEGISYTSSQGKKYYGTAALSHRMFSADKVEYTYEERQADLAYAEEFLKCLDYDYVPVL